MKRCIAAAAPAFSTVLLLLLLLHYLGCAAAGYVVPKRSARRAFTSSAVTSFTSRETTHLPPSLLLPLLRPWSKDTRENLEAVLREIVDSTAFFVDAKVTASSSVSSDNHQWQWTCSVPAFGDDCRIQLELLCSKNDLSSGTLLFSLVQDGASGAPRCATTTAGDFGWICTKFYECSAKLGAVGVDCSVQLRDFVVVQHSNCDAATAAWSAEQAASFERMLSLSLLGNDNQYYDVSPTTVVLDRLDAQGYVIIDHKDGADIGDDDCSNAFSLETTATQQELLSNYYFKHGASSQGASIRTDRVHFLSRAQAAACGVEVQYDLLMGIAHYLNNNYGEQQQRAPQAVGAPTSTWMQPVFPATVDRPFTLPRSLQFAEYGLGDYYIVRNTRV